jgi:hypothetical protein
MPELKSKSHPRTLAEGYRPVEKGWAPKVQGGFKPTSNGNVNVAPPKGGSAVKPAQPLAKN